MTINGLSMYSTTALSSVRQSAAVSGSQTAQGFQAVSTTSGNRPPRMDEASHKAALTKLQDTDPALAQKMEEFHEKIDQMREDGASLDDIQSAMKENMESLSDTEKDELKSIFGNPPQGPPPSMASVSYSKSQQMWSSSTPSAILA